MAAGLKAHSINKIFFIFGFLFSVTTLVGQTNDELYKKSVTAINKGKVEESLEHLDKILKSEARHKDALFLRAYINYYIKEYTRALADLDALVSTDTTNLEALKNRSRTKFAMNDNNGGIQDIDKMIQIAPDNETYYFDRAYYKGMAFDSEGSIKDYDKAIELNPKYKEAYANRGFAKINLLTTKGNIQPTKNQTTDACKDLKKAKQLGDNTVEDMLFVYCK